MLYRDGRLQDGVDILRQGEQTVKELLFLASIYSSEKQFGQAGMCAARRW